MTRPRHLGPRLRRRSPSPLGSSERPRSASRDRLKTAAESPEWNVVTTCRSKVLIVLRHMPVESVFPQLEPLLPLVRKPVQYVGGEVNSTVKVWDETDVRWPLLYPDAYEVGLPNQGIAILYEVLNEQEGVLAERTYSVWPALEQLMRDNKIPQFTVDAHRPVGAFDVLGVSFSTELGYTNLLTALDLAGIPLSAADRGITHPIVLAGGHAAFNPEPLADFLDAVIIGDGEEAVLQVTRIIRAWKQAGCPGRRV